MDCKKCGAELYPEANFCFEACKNLKHIKLPRNLRRISRFAFFGCNEAELCVEYRSSYLHAATCMNDLQEEGVEVVFD